VGRKAFKTPPVEELGPQYKEPLWRQNCYSHLDNQQRKIDVPATLKRTSYLEDVTARP